MLVALLAGLGAVSAGVLGMLVLLAG